MLFGVRLYDPQGPRLILPADTNKTSTTMLRDPSRRDDVRLVQGAQELIFGVVSCADCRYADLIPLSDLAHEVCQVRAVAELLEDIFTGQERIIACLLLHGELGLARLLLPINHSLEQFRQLLQLLALLGVFA